MSVEKLYSLNQASEILNTTDFTLLEMASRCEVIISYKTPRLLEKDVVTAERIKTHFGAGDYSYEIRDFSPDQAAILLSKGEVDLSEYINVYQGNDDSLHMTRYEGENLIIKRENVFITHSNIKKHPDYKEVKTPLRHKEVKHTLKEGNDKDKDEADHTITEKLFTAMDRLVFNEISIVFIDNNLIELKARDAKVTKSLGALGLIDNRSGNINSIGQILLDYSKGKKLKSHIPINRTKIKRVRGLLKQLFKAMGESFVVENGEYICQFRVNDQRGRRKGRARDEALEKTQSYDDTKLYIDEDDAAGEWLKNNDN